MFYSTSLIYCHDIGKLRRRTNLIRFISCAAALRFISYGHARLCSKWVAAKRFNSPSYDIPASTIQLRCVATSFMLERVQLSNFLEACGVYKQSSFYSAGLAYLSIHSGCFKMPTQQSLWFRNKKYTTQKR